MNNLKLAQNLTNRDIALLQTLTPNICRSHKVDINNLESCLKLAIELNKPTKHSYNEIPQLIDADEYIQKLNVLCFIRDNVHTIYDISFYGDGKGSVYAKRLNDFDGHKIKEDPKLDRDGAVCIYRGPIDAGCKIKNYKCAEHLANIMNYILHYTKGHLYGMNFALFKDTYDESFIDGDVEYFTTSKSDQVIQRGFNVIFGNPYSYNIYATGHKGCYFESTINSNYITAVIF